MKTQLAPQFDRLMLPERTDLLGTTLGDAERELATLAEGRADLLWLTHGDMKQYPPPDWALAGFSAAVDQGIDPFTPCRGSRQAREAITPGLSRFLGVEIDPATELALVPGTQAGLFCALAALVGPDDTVVLVDPDYLSNERTVRFLGGRVRHVRLRFASDRPVLDLEQLEKALSDGARLLLFSHPNNPTGAVFDGETMQRLAQLVLQYDALVLADELYSRFIYDDSAFVHILAEPGMKERCITILGPSKTESMSGFRIGCLVGPPQFVSAVADVLDVTAIRASAYAQHALGPWLSADYDFVRNRVREFRGLRDQTVERLRELEFVRIHTPLATGYLFPDVSALGLNDIELARLLIEKAGVVVNPGISFGPSGQGSFRMCFVQDEDEWSDILDRIVGALTSSYAHTS